MKLESAARLAISSVLKEGLTDIFPEPFETALLKSEEFQKVIRGEVIRGISGGSLESLRMSPLEYVLLPKTAAFDFRRCALIQPLDTIKYLAMAILFAEEIESHRPSKGRQIVFSYRFSPKKGYIFDPKYNITSFTKHVTAKAKQSKTKVLVSCDIANFYDRLNLHRLESILISLDLDKNQVRFLIQLLLFWSNRDSYGLPVGSNASRILAEASLLEVDDYLLSIGAIFCRFVDDYRLFAPDASTAHYWLTQLIERLWLEGLTINKRKTKIEDVSDWKKDEEKEVAEIKTDQEGGTTLTKGQEPESRHPFRIIAGYGGTIPTRFRQATLTERKKLSEIDAETVLNRIKSSKLASPEDVLVFVRATLYTKKYDLYLEIPSVLDKFPQFTPYVIDLFIKHRTDFPDSLKSSIANAFASKLTTQKYLPEYISISFIRILGIDGFQSGTILFDQFRALRRNAGAYIGRALLDALESVVSRGQVLEIRRYFVRADAWEKRQIVRIVDRHLHEDEKRPWLKNILIQDNSDLFMAELIAPAIKKKKKKKK
jgi:hypothetical protein